MAIRNCTLPYRGYTGGKIDCTHLSIIVTVDKLRRAYSRNTSTIVDAANDFAVVCTVGNAAVLRLADDAGDIAAGAVHAAKVLQTAQRCVFTGTHQTGSPISRLNPAQVHAILDDGAIQGFHADATELCRDRRSDGPVQLAVIHAFRDASAIDPDHAACHTAVERKHIALVGASLHHAVVFTHDASRKLCGVQFRRIGDVDDASPIDLRQTSNPLAGEKPGDLQIPNLALRTNLQKQRARTAVRFHAEVAQCKTVALQCAVEQPDRLQCLAGHINVVHQLCVGRRFACDLLHEGDEIFRCTDFQICLRAAIYRRTQTNDQRCHKNQKCSFHDSHPPSNVVLPKHSIERF